MAELKELAERFYAEVLTKGDLAVADEMIADDFVEHEEFPGLTNDKAGVMAFITMMHEAYSDIEFRPSAMITDGAEIWVQLDMIGTHTGEFMGVAPTGRSINVPTIDRIRIVDGRAVEHWGVTDGLAMMQQLGVIPDES